MNHDCAFQDHILELIRESGEQTALLKEINEKLKCQKEEVDSLMAFKNNALGFIALGGLGITLVSNLFQGCLNYLIGKH